MHCSSCSNKNIVGRGPGDIKGEMAKMERRLRGNRLTSFPYIKAAAKKEGIFFSLCLQILGQEVRGSAADKDFQKNLPYSTDSCDMLGLAGDCAVSLAGGL